MDLRPKINTVMHLAHTHPLGSHLRGENTLEKIQDRFHCPGMVSEVKTLYSIVDNVN